MTRLEGRAWRNLRAAVLRHSDVCHLCGKRIDLTLSGLHPDGPTVDHVLPVIHGGQTTWDNLKPAHRRCNLTKGDRMAKARRTDLTW